MANLDERRDLAARLRAAADAERRGIERDLHDGVQQDLAAVDVNLQLVQALVDSDLPAAKDLLAELRQHVQEALERVRALAGTIYPSRLPLHGLADALRWIPARVETTGLGRYPLELEEAVYFCCVELVRKADADAALLVSEEAESLSFTLTGAEIDAASLEVMRDRLAAFGGLLTAAAGTTRGMIPL
jgi:signal transduction histidine kinase